MFLASIFFCIQISTHVPKHCDDNPAVLVHADAGWVAQNPHAKAAEVASVLVEHLNSVVAVVADQDPVIIVNTEVPRLLHLPNPNQSDTIPEAVKDLHSASTILRHDVVSAGQDGNTDGPLELAVASTVRRRPNLAEKDSVAVKHLDSMIVEVGHGEISGLIHRHTPGSVELSLPRAFRAEGQQRRALVVKDLDPVISSISDDDTPPCPVNGQSAWSIELASPGALGAKFEEEAASTVEHLNSMISRVSHQKVTSVVGADGKWAGELPVRASLSPKREDRLMHRLVPQLIQHSDFKRTPFDVSPFQLHRGAVRSWVCGIEVDEMGPMLFLTDLDLIQTQTKE